MANEIILNVGDRLIDNSSAEKNVVEITNVEGGVVTVFSPIANPQEGKAPLTVVVKMIEAGKFELVR